MSLPLPYRPRRVLEFMEEEKLASLKLTINKKVVFLSNMVNWYKNLRNKQKDVLTKQRLYRRVLLEAHRLRLESDSIPTNWIEVMKKEANLVCYMTLKQKRKREFYAEAELTDHNSSSEKDDDRLDNGMKKFVDLTSEPPPDSWIISKMSGEVLPRHLALATTESLNILYWDYDTSHWKMDNDYRSEVETHCQTSESEVTSPE